MHIYLAHLPHDWPIPHMLTYTRMTYGCAPMANGTNLPHAPPIAPNAPPILTHTVLCHPGRCNIYGLATPGLDRHTRNGSKSYAILVPCTGGAIRLQVGYVFLGIRSDFSVMKPPGKSLLVYGTPTSRKRHVEEKRRTYHFITATTG